MAIAAHCALILGASRLPSARALLRAGSLPPPAGAMGVDLDLEPAPPPAPSDERSPAPPPVESPPPAPPHTAEDHREPPPTGSPLALAARAGANAPVSARASGDPSGDPSADPSAPSSGGASTGPISGGASPPAPRGAEGAPQTDEYGGAAAAPTLDRGSQITLGFALHAADAAPTSAPHALEIDPSAASRAIASTLRSHDKKAGVNVPAAGVVVAAVSTTVRGMSLPHNAHATIEVTLGPHGKVAGARVASASAGDAAQWDAAMKAIAGSLASQSLALGPDVDKTGVVFRVSVTQKHVFPSGTAKGADVKPVCANGFINELATAADDKPTKPIDPKVPLLQDENGRPCIPVGVSVSGDASNIGAEKHIEVQSSFDVIVPGQADLPEQIDPVNTDAPWVERGKPGPRPTLPQKARQYLREREKRK